MKKDAAKGIDGVAPMLAEAVALHQQGRIEDAARLYQKILAVAPGTVDAMHMLGVVALQRGRFLEAQRLIAGALAANPLMIAAIGNLGTSYLRNGQRDVALHWFDVALKLEPHSEIASQNVATTQDLGPTHEPITVPMLIAAANVLLANELNEEAIVQLRRALALDPDNLMIRWVMAIAVLKGVYRSDAEMTESRRQFSASLDEIKAWYGASPKNPKAHEAVGAIQPFFLVYQPYNNRDLLTRYGALCALWMGAFHAQRNRPAAISRRPADDRLRLGIVSSHIREHSVWAAITKGWVQHLDRRKIDLHLFHLNGTVDAETLQARAAVDHFDSGHADLTGWIKAISASNLDAIIYPEIGMDPVTLKLAALRLAPWQAVSWGQPETSGLETIDVYLSSEAMEPANAAENYSEKLVLLPNLGVYCEPLAPTLSDTDLSALKLPQDEPLLLCPGSPFKYAPVNDVVWVQIANGLRKKLFRKNSGGRLVFFRSHSATQDRILEARLRAAFSAGGVDFDSRVCIIPYLPRAGFYSLMRVSALMLDTLEFSGFNTVLQAVEGGLPMLTFDGEFLRGRLASGVMRRLDLPELIAATPDVFVARALELASAPAKLADLRKKMAARRDVLFHDLTAVRALENYLLDNARQSATKPP